MEPLQLCILWYIVFVFSVVLHEYAHAFAGYLYGDHTAAHHGLATLNPIPHIQRSPLGMIIVPLLSFVGAGWMIGWASTPYDPYWARANPKQAAMVSLAGPAANLLLVIIAGLFIRLGLAAGLFHLPQSFGFTTLVEANANGFPTGLAVLLSILFTLNLVLLVFNLIPVPPLDGVAIGELVLRGEILYKYRQLMQHPTLRMFGIFIAWMVLNRVFGPVFGIALQVLYGFQG